MSNKFSVGDIWADSSNRRYRIICTDAPGAYPVITYRMPNDSADNHLCVVTDCFTSSGSYTTDEVSQQDLVRKCLPVQEYWFIRLGNGSGVGYNFRGPFSDENTAQTVFLQLSPLYIGEAAVLCLIEKPLDSEK